ncbi:MAG: DNA-binding response regulator [Gammaproteobacteria bacterium]|nr:MAG: DNA-binding response regulator [Gammaproteobacteria bacterium]
MRALIVEDDTPLRQALAAALRDAGWSVEEAADGREGLYQASEYPVDVAVVDLGLPGMSGMALVTALREAGRDVPILILTARDRWQDKVAGLKAGADDYVVKPFHPEELIARLEALVRRASGWARPQLCSGAVRLDTGSQSVSVAGRSVELTGFEYRLLEILMLHAGEVVSKTELTERLYAQDFDRDSNTIEVFIGRLRRKLDPEGSLQPIETLRGRGYRMTRTPLSDDAG